MTRLEHLPPKSNVMATFLQVAYIPGKIQTIPANNTQPAVCRAAFYRRGGYYDSLFLTVNGRAGFCFQKKKITLFLCV